MKISVAELADALNAQAVGKLDLEITGPAEPAAARADQLALAMLPEYRAGLSEGQARAAILWDGADWQELGLEAAIFVPRPRYAMAGVNRIFGQEPEVAAGIHETAVIDASAEIGAGAAIGPFVVIGRGAKIGRNARILPHVSIAEDVVIGDNALIHSGARIGARVRIGQDFICHANAAIGNDGFSFVSPERGAIDDARAMKQVARHYDATEYARINSLGTVVIGDRVEVGAITGIDRGTIADTVIGSGTKIDNLVQIGHNCRIGKNCLISGHGAIGGSTVVGDGTVLGGKVGVADHVLIGENVVAAGGSGILSNVPSNRVIMGAPAVKMESYVESYKAIRRLPRLVKKVQELEKRLSMLDGNA